MDYLLNINLSQPLYTIGNLNWQKMSRFGQLINNDPNTIIILRSIRQTNNEIHGK